MHNAIEQLEPVAKTLSKKIYNDLEHSINEEGIIEGLNFIKKECRYRNFKNIRR